MEAIIKVHPQSVKWYVDRSWNFSYQTLWYKCLLNDDEIFEIKNRLQEMYQSIPAEDFKSDAEKYFHQFGKQIETLSNRKDLSRELLLDFFKTLMWRKEDLRPIKRIYLDLLLSKDQQKILLHLFY